MKGSRTGAHALLSAAQAAGIRVCFANPGTTELGLVRALDEVPAIRPVLGLFEGVCTGAADGYARVAGVPALTLLHLGPGLANGLANLHNARRANSPVVNIIGDHATWHLPFDAPLTSDIEGLARPMSRSVIRLNSAGSVERSLRRAVVESMSAPRGVVTVIAPSDLMDAPVPESASESVSSSGSRCARRVPAERIAHAAARLTAQDGVIILLGGDALTERGQRAAMRIAAAAGARLLMESYPAIVPLGGDLPPLERLAYFPQDVIAQLGSSMVLLVGARAPVSYFGYAGQPSELVASGRLVELSTPEEDGVTALEQLAGQIAARPDFIAAPGSAPPAHATTPPAHATTPPAHATTPLVHSHELTPAGLAQELVEQIPQDAIVSLEGSTCGGPYLQRAHGARRHWVMTNTGGAIGQGIPCALGAAIARPDARVIGLQSDGSAQYTVQALWTIAREQLNVTVIICANHRYGILQTELRRAGAELERPALARMTQLDSPRVDWVALAGGYGVPGVRATTSSEFRAALATALRAAGPYLIEAQLT